MKIFITVVVLLFIMLVVLGFLSAKMESDTYNRLTGARTTWWDACWVELRVQDKTMPEP